MNFNCMLGRARARASGNTESIVRWCGLAWLIFLLVLRSQLHIIMICSSLRTELSSTVGWTWAVWPRQVSSSPYLDIGYARHFHSTNRCSGNYLAHLHKVEWNDTQRKREGHTALLNKWRNGEMRVCAFSAFKRKRLGEGGREKEKL